MKKNFLSIVILTILFIISCDDNPSKIENNIVPLSSNITFTPDTLYISDDINKNTVRFEGVDFIKYKPDSVRFNDFKVDIIQNDNEHLIVKVPFKYIGQCSINMFFASGMITLEKTITLSTISNFDNIYFMPDTLKITTYDSQAYFLLKGMNFNFLVDSVFVGSQKCYLSFDKIYPENRIVDSVRVTIPDLVLGSFEVVVFIKGQKIALPKKLVVTNPNLETDFTKLNKITWEFRNIPILQEKIVRSFSQGKFETTESFDTTQFVLVRGNSEEEIHVVYIPMSEIRGDIYGYYSPIRFNYYFDTKKGYLKYININTYNRFVYNGYQNVEEKGGFSVYNVPYTVKFLSDDKVEMEIKISGKSIDNNYPYGYYNNSVTTESHYYETSVNTIPKKDPITGKDINYFPATDSSLIVIHLRNF